ncbi:hypothetical protein [Moraxella nasicaprae]|uniref:DUF5658 domain-containing protein n=1 Tax=Moraxella nasicaprae TaxID=2904122 RepID=A0ABY6F2D2_9GAMM|nr:hypothetical protein [Moraxella nasicaprae]UXZ04239.1 hypothetical protein LU297_06410 [Moraxella nasicaprae]
MKLAKFLCSFWGVCLFITLDVLLFWGLSYDTIEWYFGDSHLPDWVVQKGIAVITETFIAMLIGFIVLYLLYFSLLSYQIDHQKAKSSSVIIMTVVFMVVKVAMLCTLAFFSYFVRYL